MYIKNPSKIEDTSMDIIDKVMGDVDFEPLEELIVKRMIHTTGDFDYRKIVEFRGDFIKVAREALSKGVRIYTDTQMAYAGINKKALKASGSSLEFFIDREELYELAKKKATTRSSCAIDLAVEEGIDIFVIGNAPTALYRILELYKEGKLKPRFIVGVPVGFVGAAESKEYLREFEEIPSISTRGTKGGSNVAASIINGLLYTLVDRPWG